MAANKGMDVTCSNLRDTRRFHRLMLNDLEPFDSLHLIYVDDRPVESRADVHKIEGLWTTFAAQVPLEFFLHPLFLDIATEYNLMALSNAPRNLYRLQLKCDKTLQLVIKKELYEKFGIDGKPLNRGRTEFVIKLNLADDDLRMGGKLRAKILNTSTAVFPPQLLVNFCCSALAFECLASLFSNLRYPPPTKGKVLETVQNYELPCPDLLTIMTTDIPEPYDLEDWNLWCGAICSNSNTLLQGGRLDSFISVCRLPEGPFRHVAHHEISGDGPFSSGLVAEIIEKVAEGLSARQTICFMGRSECGRGRTGFSLFLKPNLDYVFCSFLPDS